MTATISVKLSGSDNRARILSWGISAGSTHSSESAVRAAANKLAARTGKAVVRLERVTHSLTHELWQLTMED